MTLLLAAGALSGLGPRASVSAAEPASKIVAVLQARVDRDAEDGSAWRLLGRARRRRGELDEAEAAFRRSVELEPLSAAAHADLGTLLAESERSAEARRHLRAAIELAPESEYAGEAREALAALPETAEPAGEIQRVGYEITRFFKADVAEDRLPDDPPDRPAFAPPFSEYSVWIEAGLLYNTNVALAPSSRQLAPGTRDSLQLLFSPELEVPVLDDDGWLAGPTLAGDFTLNQGRFADFNLQSYRPGAFVSREFAWASGVVVPRLDYLFAHDEFRSTTFANRHAVTMSLTELLPDGDAWLAHYSLEHTNFAEDGLLPVITSPDGWTNSLGVSRDWRFDRRHLELVRVGLDLQRVDADGSDYRFNGIAVHTRGVLPLAEKYEAVLQGSLGYRDYFDFEFAPSRNEVVWRIGGELRRYFSDDLWLAGVFAYDRFDANNPLFAAERTLAGAVLTYRR